MLSFLRGIIHSKVGMIVTFGILIVIALAFAAGDVTGLASGGGILGHPLAAVDGEKVTADDIRRRAQDEIRAARQQQPDLDMATFVRAGLALGELPEYMARRDASLVRVWPDRQRATPYETWLVLHRDLAHTARVRVVVDAIAAAFAD